MAVHSLDIFSKKDGSDEASVSSDVYIKLNGYAFRFVLEEEDFVPDVDFIPRIWENHDNGHDDGANRDEDMPDRDANKRSKCIQAVDQNSASGSQVSAAVPIQSTQQIVHTATLESSVVSMPENMDTHIHVPVVQESMDACIPMQDELEKGGSTRCTTMHVTDAGNDSAAHVKATTVVHGPPAQPTAAISVCVAGHAQSAVHLATTPNAHSTVHGATPALTPLQPALTPAAHAILPASVGVRESKTSPMMESPVRAAVAMVPLGPAADRARGSSSASDAGVRMGATTPPSSPTLGTLRTTPALQRTTSTTPSKTLTGTTSGGLATPLRRSNRHSLNVDGSSSTDEHSLAKAMRLQASRNLDPMTGTSSAQSSLSLSDNHISTSLNKVGVSMGNNDNEINLSVRVLKHMEIDRLKVSPKCKITIPDPDTEEVGEADAKYDGPLISHLVGEVTEVGLDDARPGSMFCDFMASSRKSKSHSSKKKQKPPKKAKSSTQTQVST